MLMPKHTDPSHRRSRSQQRRDNHDQQSQEKPTTAPIPKLPYIPPHDPEILGTADAVSEFITHIRNLGSFAFDTEFIGEDSYFPKICLVQLATTERVALIDPLTGIDLTPIWELVVDDEIETIVHAGEQDLATVIRSLDRSPKHIFDTQIAAGFAKLPYPMSLRRLVQELLNHHLPKAMTFTQWDHRPLSKRHMHYAADDVRYLPLMRRKLGELIEPLGHMDWLWEECATRSSMDAYIFHPDVRFERVLGRHRLRPREVAILRELVHFREDAAKKADVPPQTWLKDPILLRMAKERVKTIDQLHNVRGLPRPVIEQHGQDLLDAVLRGKSISLEDFQSYRVIEESPQEEIRINGLWSLARLLCHSQGVDSALVMHRRDVADCYHNLTRQHAPRLPKIMEGWRKILVGDPLTRITRQESSLDVTFEDNRVRVYEQTENSTEAIPPVD